jgi:hypothetical protein
MALIEKKRGETLSAAEYNQLASATNKKIIKKDGDVVPIAEIHEMIKMGLLIVKE